MAQRGKVVFRLLNPLLGSLAPAKVSWRVLLVRIRAAIHSRLLQAVGYHGQLLQGLRPEYAFTFAALLWGRDGKQI